MQPGCTRRDVLETAGAGLAAGVLSSGRGGAQAGTDSSAEPGDVIWRFEEVENPRAKIRFGSDVAYVTDESRSSPVYGLDSDTGDVMWTYEPGDGSVLGHSRIGADRSYFYDRPNGVIHAIDPKTGNKEWVFDDAMGDIGHLNTVQDGESIIFASHEGATVYKLDAASGTVDWRTEIDASRVSSLKVHEDQGYAVVSAASADLVALLSLQTGETHWEVSPDGGIADENIVWTVIQGDETYVATKRLYVLGTETGEVHRTLADDATNVARPHLDGDDIYLEVDGGQVRKYDARTGEERWRFEPAADVSPLFEQRGIDEYGYVFVDTWGGGGDANALLALDVATGNVAWRVDAEDSVIGPSFPRGGPIYFYTTRYESNDEVTFHYAVDPASGDVRWRTKLPHRTAFSYEWREPLYVTTWDGWAYSIDATTGDVRWSFEAAEYDDSIYLSLGADIALAPAGSTVSAIRIRNELPTTESTAEVSITPRALEPVQVVADTYVSSQAVTTDVPDPDLVANRPTAVLFEVEADSLASLADDDEVQVTVTQTLADDTTVTETGRLRGETIRRLNRGDESAMSMPVDRVLQDAPEDRRPPVFTLDPAVSSISVSVDGTGDGRGPTVGGSTATIERNSDFTLAQMDPLSVGFIGISAPQTTREERREAMGLDLADLTEEERQEEVPAYGLPTGMIGPEAESGSREDFEELAERCADYLRRTYPVPSVSYEVHPDYLEGTTSDGLETDLRRAHDELHQEFPDADFDETIAIVPLGYHLYQYDKPAGGVHLNRRYESDDPDTTVDLSQPQAASSLQWNSNMRGAASVAAQEVGHHFLGPSAYPDDLAMRQRDGEVEIDNSHARTEREADTFDPPALRSRAYDLWDGTFRLLQEGGGWGYWAGDGGDDEWTLGSFMSYTTDARWADSYCYQSLIDDELSPTPMVELAGLETVPILSGSGDVSADGNLEIQEVTTREGRPSPETTQGEVTLEVAGDDGRVIESRTIPSSLQVLGHGGGNGTLDGRFTFAIPYPRETRVVSVREDRTGAETRVNPLERTLRTAIENVPDRAFTSDQATQRQRLRSLVETIDEEMEEEEYETAMETASTLREAVIESVRADVETTAGEYSQSEILTLVDDVRERLLAIARSGGLIERWGPYLGGGAAALGLAGLYRYLRSD